MIRLKHSLLLTSKLWYKARVRLWPVPLVCKITAPNLICYFTSHLVAFGFRTSSPLDKITLNAASKKTDQRISDFWTGIGAVAHATLDTEQLISCTRTTLADIIALCGALIETLFQFQKCMNYLHRFMTLWTMPCVNGLVIQLVLSISSEFCFKGVLCSSHHNFSSQF